MTLRCWAHRDAGKCSKEEYELVARQATIDTAGMQSRMLGHGQERRATLTIIFRVL
jgi:hypothetical protein